MPNQAVHRAGSALLFVKDASSSDSWLEASGKGVGRMRTSKSCLTMGFIALIGTALLMAAPACTSSRGYTFTIAPPTSTAIATTAPAIQPTTQPPFSQAPKPKLSSIAVTPGFPSLQVGLALQFFATGTYSDGSTSDVSDLVTWASSSTDVATNTPGGLVTGVAPGSTNIQASFNGLNSPPVTLTVVSQ